MKTNLIISGIRSDHTKIRIHLKENDLSISEFAMDIINSVIDSPVYQKPPTRKLEQLFKVVVDESLYSEFQLACKSVRMPMNHAIYYYVKNLTNNVDTN